jgi:hypothetical protein
VPRGRYDRQLILLPDPCRIPCRSLHGV